MRTTTLLWLLFAQATLMAQDTMRWKLSRSLITFVSEAPLEHIEATNEGAAGVLDLGSRAFAVQIPMAEFEGFNSPLQREHFNENYMDSRTHANATFAGRLIESVDLTTPGRYGVRAKGDLVIHGVKKERIIPCEVVVARDGIRVSSDFDVAVDEHGIRIPRVVQQKVAPVVRVKVYALFKAPAAAR